MFELQVIYWGHFILPELNISWICETKTNTIIPRSVRVCWHTSFCLRLTCLGAAEDLQPHTQRAVPTLRDDSHVTGQHGHGQLVHHWSVLIAVPKEQLDETEK